MSTELKGHGGQIVGSDGYFKSLNGSQLIGKLMRSPERCNYFDAIADAGNKAQNVFEEIYQDLRNQIGSIRGIPAANREGLVRMIHGLEGVCAMASCQSGRASACISILELRDPATAPQTNYSERELDDAARLMRGGGTTQLSSFEREETVRNAAEWGESYAIGSNPMRAIFLAELGYGRNREFYAEVMEKLKASNAFSSIRGRCGQDIGSAWYQDYMEREVFGDAAKNFYDSVDYAQVIRKSLLEIAQTLENDVSQGTSGDAYMTYDNRKQILDCAHALSRVSMQTKGSLERDLEKLRRLEDFNNKIIEIGKTGSSYPVEAKLEWENGKNVLYLTAHIDYNASINPPIFGKNNIAYLAIQRKNDDWKNTINDGINKWNGSYSVFGNQNVSVKCTIVERNKGQQLNFMHQNLNDRSAAIAADWWKKGLWGWKANSTLGKTIFLSQNYDSDVVSHEFGHMLGIGDLYSDDLLGLPGVPHGTYPELQPYEFEKNGEEHYNTVMYNNSGPVTDNDAEMIIRAFQTGLRQNYQVQNLWPFSYITDVSDTLGK